MCCTMEEIKFLLSDILPTFNSLRSSVFVVPPRNIVEFSLKILSSFKSNSVIDEISLGISWTNKTITYFSSQCLH